MGENCSAEVLPALGLTCATKIRIGRLHVCLRPGAVLSEISYGLTRLATDVAPPGAVLAHVPGALAVLGIVAERKVAAKATHTFDGNCKALTY